MKKIVLSIVTTLFCAIMILPNIASAQIQPEPKKVAYNFINEYGFYAGKRTGFTSVFVNGVILNNSDALGIGLGYGLTFTTEHSGAVQEIPLFLNYRHYFNRGRKLVPLINIGLGTSVNIWDQSDRVPVYVGEDIDHYEWNQVNKHGFGLYTTVASGFKVKAFSFTAGIFFKTFPADKVFSGGVEVKVGYTF